MKLLVLSSHFAPRFEGGSEVVARAQAREMARRGHEVRVLAGCDTPHRGIDLEAESVDGLPVEFLPRSEGERYDLLLQRPRIVEIILAQARSADAVHLHGWATLASGLVQALSASLPVIVSLHDLFVTCPRFFRLPQGGVQDCPPRGEFEACVRCVSPDAPGRSAQVLLAELTERATHWQAELDAAAAVVLPSKSQRERLDALVTLDPMRTHVVPHGLCQPVERAGAAVEWTGQGPLRILHMGNLTAAKGVLELAKAAATLAAGGVGIELVFAGGAVEEGIEAELRRLSGKAVTHFLGHFSMGDLAGRLAQLGGCHLAVLPSRAFESYALVVDEALALGLPTWVSDRGAPKERVFAAGRVLPAENVRALALALDEILREPDVLARQKAAIPEHLPDAARAAGEIERLLLGLMS